MFKEYRQRSWTAGDWAKDLGIEADSTLSSAALNRFRARTSSDLRWREIRRRVSVGASVLDAGCGMGQWVWFLNTNGLRSTGLDYSADMIDLLNKRVPDCSWIHGSVQEIPGADASFDAVVSWGVVEHDESGPQAALAEFFRVLKPGGYAFVTTPLDSPATRASSAIQFPHSRENGEFFQYFFSEQDLKELLTGVGFVVESTFRDSRGYPVLFPRLYNFIATRGRLVNGIMYYLTAPLVALLPGSCGMALAVARKPES